jgi:copper chaperone
MKQVTINVPDMQSVHCQTRVNNAVKNIAGVQVEEVKAGKLTVSVPSDDTKNEVINAIEKAGYTVSEAEGDGDSTGSSCCQ